MSPYLQRGTQLPLLVRVEKNKPKTYWAISADIITGGLTSSVGNRFMYNQTGFSFTWLKSLQSFSGIRPLIGGSWNNTIINTERSFMGQNESSWIGGSAFAVHGKIEKGDRKKWFVDVDQSILAANVRPGYLNSPSRLKFGRLMQTKVSFSWQTQFSPLFTLRGTALFSYLYSGRPTKENAASVIDTGVHVTIMYRVTAEKNARK